MSEPGARPDVTGADAANDAADVTGADAANDAADGTGADAANDAANDAGAGDGADAGDGAGAKRPVIDKSLPDRHIIIPEGHARGERMSRGQAVVYWLTWALAVAVGRTYFR